jgi:hypothetical protein
MAVDVSAEIEIARPRSEVAAFASDPRNAPVWYHRINEVRWNSAKPLAAGSRIVFVAEFMGRRVDFAYDVEELVPDERFVMRTEEGPFPIETTYAWEDTAGGGTRMSLRSRGQPSGFSRLARPFVAGAMRRANRKDLKRLKAVLEARPAG